MKNWKGCRGLDAHVAIHVTNAMPPYLIANESKSPFPFSASNSSSVKVRLQICNYMDPSGVKHRSDSLFGNQADVTQQSHMQVESKDLEYLLPIGSLRSHVDLSGSTDLSLAYEGTGIACGPIVLSTSQHNSASETTQLNPNATCWEILTLRLGRFARQYIEKHGAISLTDELLQNEARVILYDETDGWEQTAADNSEWLNLFKKAHGIDTAASTTSK
jgi:hypothetical protein